MAGPRTARANNKPTLSRRRYHDKNGDIAMTPAPSTSTGTSSRSRDSGGVSKSSRPNTRKVDLISKTSQRAILKHVGLDDISMQEGRPRPSSRAPVEVKITGWTKSKASTSPDGGVSSLITWLEKKASSKLGTKSRSVKIKKLKVDGEELTVSVHSEDAGALLRLNTWGWAGINLTIERVDGTATQLPSDAEKVKSMLRGVLERRYNLEAKLLDLSALGQDEELRAQAMFDTKSTTGKFFPALMRVLDLSFDNHADRDAAITSVALSNNEFADLTAVTSLSQTLPKLLNLDLSNNKLASTSILAVWRRRFPNLQHIILTGNPIEQAEPAYPEELMKWYRNLRMVNGVQVRTEEEVGKKSKSDLPFPMRSPLFQDENGIAETFVRTFIAGFDSDRAALAAHYYDDSSDFSFAVNTAAPRDSSEQTEKQEWENYIKGSRNLKKISHIPARQNRMFHGAKAVTDAFTALPKTRHPDLATDPSKYMIEAHIQPCIMDPTGMSPSGVDGFFISIHGEFEEDETTTKKKRSFDRTFIIGAGGPAGVRVVCDMLTVRAYGGTEAFNPDNLEGWQSAAPQAIDTTPQPPAGITIEIAEQMVVELQKQTSMTVQYAKDCLDQVGWDFDKALAAFASVRANLPVEAFVQAA